MPNQHTMRLSFLCRVDYPRDLPVDPDRSPFLSFVGCILYRLMGIDKGRPRVRDHYHGLIVLPLAFRTKINQLSRNQHNQDLLVFIIEYRA
jgi:hypothetical protein